MGGGKASTPPARDLYAETSDTLRAQVDLAPELYAAEAQFRPLYNQLDLQSLEEMLMGTKGGTRTVSRTVDDVTPAGFYDAQGRLVSTDPMWKPTAQQRVDARRYGEADPMGGVVWRQQQVTPRTFNETVTSPEQRGILSIYEQDLMPALNRMESQATKDRLAGEMDLLRQYGPETTRLLRESSGNAGLLAELERQSMSELQAGARLDPSLRRETQQAIRSAQAARGMGYGMGDLAAESTMTALQAEQLRRNRQQFAMQTAGLLQQTGADPFMALFSRPSQSFSSMGQTAQQGMGMAKTAGPQLFNPESQYAQDLYNTNYNAQAAANIANANAKSAMTGSLIGAGGAIAGAAIGAIAL